MSNFREYVESHLEALKEKKSYITKQAVIRDYQALEKEIDNKEREIDKLVEAFDIDNAQIAGEELEKLKSRRTMMQPTYDRMRNIPDFQDDDLYDIYLVLKDGVNAALDEAYARKRELTKQVEELEKEIASIYHSANSSREYILSKSENRKNMKTQLKFHDF